VSEELWICTTQLRRFRVPSLRQRAGDLLANRAYAFGDGCKARSSVVVRRSRTLPHFVSSTSIPIDHDGCALFSGEYFQDKFPAKQLAYPHRFGRALLLVRPTDLIHLRRGRPVHAPSGRRQARENYLSRSRNFPLMPICFRSDALSVVNKNEWRVEQILSKRSFSLTGWSVRISSSSCKNTLNRSETPPLADKIRVLGLEK
jgi:hypothetical protein